MTLEQSLRALAADDAAAQVPPHVDAAVMAAWDARSRGRGGRERVLRPGRAALAWALAGVFFVILVAFAVIVKPRAGDDRPGHVRRDSAAEESAAPVVVAETVVSPHRLEQPKPRRRASIAPPSMDAAYVLVPDTGAGAPPLTMMRVRMARSAFSRLGVPIANPDGDGMVDVEVLVGEDGVARSIRRAAAVGWVDENR